MPDETEFVDPFAIMDQVVDEHMAEQREIAAHPQEQPPARASSSSLRSAYLRQQAVPDGWHIHHLCGNPWCRNPEHLIALSPEDHRKIHGTRSYCAR